MEEFSTNTEKEMDTLSTYMDKMSKLLSVSTADKPPLILAVDLGAISDGTLHDIIEVKPLKQCPRPHKRVRWRASEGVA